MSWWKRFVTKPLTQTISQASWFGFVLTTIVIAAAVNIVTGALLTLFGIGWTVTSLAVAAALAVAYANVYSYRLEQRIAEGDRVLGERPHPSSRKGLVLMVTKAPTAAKAIDYHRQTLQHVWLIVTPEMRDAAVKLRTHAETYGISSHLLELEQEYDANKCYYLVRNVFERFAGEHLLAPNEVIADMTGGTKPMTAGMVLACNDLNAALEHVPTRFVGDGQPTIPLDPIEVLFAHSKTSGADSRK